ncbi:MAG: AAA family ATPase [Oscillospiraceae bacterium]|jgi:chromosome segregation ATPase|nr:AAA family ATPase [Oscillospiraceae bacterium]
MSQDSITIQALELENVKRIRTVTLTPTANGLTVIGGRNGQGKTSVLDAIAWALGGDRFKPSNPGRDEAAAPPYLKITLSNGLIVERKGLNGNLKVTDPTGQSAGQTLLNKFVETLALNLPRFMQAGTKEKAKTLLRILGVEEELTQLEKQELSIYSQRHSIGQIADQKRKYADEMPNYPDAPTDLLSVSELINRQQSILAQNGENQRKRQQLSLYQTQLTDVQAKLTELHRQEAELQESIRLAQMSAQDLVDQSTAAIEQDIANIEEINRRVRANLDKERAKEDAENYGQQYQNLSGNLDETRERIRALLEGANLPLPGLTIKDGELTYLGQPWDCMSGSDKLKVATAIVRKLNPNCGFVLLDKLEQMDTQTLAEFGAWLKTEGLQCIATRVSSGGECSIIIEDGLVADSATTESAAQTSFTTGVF